jgi:hypothetical protein
MLPSARMLSTVATNTENNTSIHVPFLLGLWGHVTHSITPTQSLGRHTGGRTRSARCAKAGDAAAARRGHQRCHRKTEGFGTPVWQLENNESYTSPSGFTSDGQLASKAPPGLAGL